MNYSKEEEALSDSDVQDNDVISPQSSVDILNDNNYMQTEIEPMGDKVTTDNENNYVVLPVISNISMNDINKNLVDYTEAKTSVDNVINDAIFFLNSSNAQIELMHESGLIEKDHEKNPQTIVNPHYEIKSIITHTPSEVLNLEAVSRRIDEEEIKTKQKSIIIDEDITNEIFNSEVTPFDKARINKTRRKVETAIDHKSAKQIIGETISISENLFQNIAELNIIETTTNDSFTEQLITTEHDTNTTTFQSTETSNNRFKDPTSNVQLTNVDETNIFRSTLDNDVIIDTSIDHDNTTNLNSATSNHRTSCISSGYLPIPVNINSMCTDIESLDEPVIIESENESRESEIVTNVTLDKPFNVNKLNTNEASTVLKKIKMLHLSSSTANIEMINEPVTKGSEYELISLTIIEDSIPNNETSNSTTETNLTQSFKEKHLNNIIKKDKWSNQLPKITKQLKLTSNEMLQTSSFIGCPIPSNTIYLKSAITGLELIEEPVKKNSDFELIDVVKLRESDAFHNFVQDRHSILNDTCLHKQLLKNTTESNSLPQTKTKIIQQPPLITCLFPKTTLNLNNATADVELETDETETNDESISLIIMDRTSENDTINLASGTADESNVTETPLHNVILNQESFTEPLILLNENTNSLHHERTKLISHQSLTRRQALNVNATKTDVDLIDEQILTENDYESMQPAIIKMISMNTISEFDLTTTTIDTGPLQNTTNTNLPMIDGASGVVAHTTMDNNVLSLESSLDQLAQRSRELYFFPQARPNMDQPSVVRCPIQRNTVSKIDGIPLYRSTPTFPTRTSFDHTNLSINTTQQLPKISPSVARITGNTTNIQDGPKGNLQMADEQDPMSNDPSAPESLLNAPPSYSFVMRQISTRARPRYMGTFVASPSYVTRPPPPTYATSFDLYVEPPMPPIPPIPPNTFGLQPVLIVCPECGNLVLTVVRSEMTLCTHLCAGCLCLCMCWLCAPIPYLLRSCKNVYHNCPICRSYLGMYSPTNTGTF